MPPRLPPRELAIAFIRIVDIISAIAESDLPFVVTPESAVREANSNFYLSQFRDSVINLFNNIPDGDFMAAVWNQFPASFKSRGSLDLELGMSASAGDDRALVIEKSPNRQWVQTVNTQQLHRALRDINDRAIWYRNQYQLRAADLQG